MKKYINDKLSELKRYYNAKDSLITYCGNDLKHQWQKDYKEVTDLWKSIVNMNDVEKYFCEYENSVNRYIDSKSCVDYYYVNLSLYKLTYSIEKMAACYDNDRYDFHFNNMAEIDELFEKLYKQISIMQDETLRRSIVGEC